VKRQACCGRKAEPPHACGVSSSLCYHDSLPFPSLHAIMEINGPVFGLSHLILIGNHIQRSCSDPCHNRIILPGTGTPHPRTTVVPLVIIRLRWAVERVDSSWKTG